MEKLVLMTLRSLLKQVKNTKKEEMKDRCIAAGHAMIRTTHIDELCGPAERYDMHQHWQAACQTVIARKNDEKVVFGFFPKEECVRNSLFSGDMGLDPAYFAVLYPGASRPAEMDDDEIVIGWGLERKRVSILSRLPPTPFDLSDPSWGSVARWDGNSLTRKSGSGKTNYVVVPLMGECIPIPPDLWEEEENLLKYITEIKKLKKHEMLVQACLACPRTLSEIVPISDHEVRRQVEGVWQHKHEGYDYWHPMARVHRGTDSNRDSNHGSG